MANGHLTSAAITDAQIFMALAMLVTRVIIMGVRAHALSTASRPVEVAS
jgi:hypothetical protein